MRSSIVFVASLLFLTACVTTQPANFYSLVPNSISEISEYDIELDVKFVPVIVDYKRTENDGFGAQSAAMSFGVLGAVVGSLVESAITESKTSSARTEAELRTAEIRNLIDSVPIKPVVQKSLETSLSQYGKATRRQSDTARLKITPIVGTSANAKSLLLKLIYEG